MKSLNIIPRDKNICKGMTSEKVVGEREQL